jgi:hypothetical protein
MLCTHSWRPLPALNHSITRLREVLRWGSLSESPMPLTSFAVQAAKAILSGLAPCRPSIGTFFDTQYYTILCKILLIVYETPVINSTPVACVHRVSALEQIRNSGTAVLSSCYKAPPMQGALPGMITGTLLVMLPGPMTINKQTGSLAYHSPAINDGRHPRCSFPSYQPTLKSHRVGQGNLILL